MSFTLRVFILQWNLDRHTRNHGGGGAFQCRACDFTADIRQSLTVHETNHHDPPVHPAIRGIIGPFERKARNGQKRYNQVCHERPVKSRNELLQGFDSEFYCVESKANLLRGVEIDLFVYVYVCIHKNI